MAGNSQINLIALSILIGLLPRATLAASQSSSDMKAHKKHIPYVLTLSGGPVWASAGETQTVYLAPDSENSYVAINETHTFADGEFFLGLQQTIQDNWYGQLGLAVVTTGNMPLKGSVWGDADQNFNNYQYTYNIKHSHITLKGKLLADIEFALIPYASASLGVGFNQSHNFMLTETIPEAAPVPEFSSKTTTSFTYNLGVGLQRMINTHWQIGAGYEFTSWGQSQLGLAPGQTLGHGLSLSNLYTHGLQLNISYLA